MFNPYSQPSPRPGRLLFDPTTPRQAAPIQVDQAGDIVLSPTDTLLYTHLNALKDAIQAKAVQGPGGQGKRKPTVCSDKVLRLLAIYRPTTAEELSNIPGVGDQFMELYSSQFLSLIQASSPKERLAHPPTTDAQRATLAMLENQLTSINRRNRLLYLPKIRPGIVWDVTAIPTKTFARKALFGSASATLSDTFEDSRAPKRVVRQATRYHRETGQQTLFIAYPFVTGCLPGDRFEVRAPLAFIPVVATAKGNGLAIKRDDQRDVVFNHTLLLAHYKTTGRVGTLPDTALDDIDSETFLDTVLKVYADEGLDIQTDAFFALGRTVQPSKHDAANDTPSRDASAAPGTSQPQVHPWTGTAAGDQPDANTPTSTAVASQPQAAPSLDVLDYPLQSFTNYLSGEFPKVDQGDLQLEHVAVLGHFPMFDNAIQSDIAQIAAMPTMPPLVGEFLSSIDDAEVTPDITEPLPVVESQLYTINPLNASQEHVVNAMRGREALVVQGPPGTGKSQVITSLIADYVAKDRSVLMVSEKRSALDVVYSRLGPLNSHALLLDNLHNKDLLYSQIVTILNATANPTATLPMVFEQGQAIDAQIERLHQVASMYQPSELGITIATLYLAAKWMDIHANPLDHERYRVFMAHAAGFTQPLRYPELNAARNLFDDGITLDRCSLYLQSIHANPWINDLKPALTPYETMQVHDEIQGLATLAEHWRSRNVFSRWWNRRSLTNQLTSFFAAYCEHNPDAHAQAMLTQGIDVQALQTFGIDLNNKALYDSLTHADLAYLNAIIVMMTQLQVPGPDANTLTYDTALATILFTFEAQHRDISEAVSRFPALVEHIRQLMNEKIQMTIQAIRGLLVSDVTNGIPAKQHAEMLRLATNKRRRSTTSFLTKFWPTLRRSVHIWMMTPEVASEALPLQPGLFDLVVFDEASQMYPEKGIPALYRAKQVVIAGDSQQLRPSSIGKGRLSNVSNEDEDDMQEAAAVLEEESFLDVANAKFVPPVVLNVHYRSRYEELIAFSNYALYDGSLMVSPNVRPPAQAPIQVIHTPEGRWDNQTNVVEARRVVDLLADILQTRRDQDTIGIITFNAKQRDLIEDLIEDTAQTNPALYEQLVAEMGRTDNGEDIGLFVKNIENVQGDERDIIVFSTAFGATQDSDKVANRFGSLSHQGGENRLNVAISRAKRQIYVVTSITPDQLNTDTTTYRGPKLLKAYLQYCYAISNGDTRLAQTILQSLSPGSSRPDQPADEVALYDTLVTKVEQGLQAAGLETARNVGIGGYTIELAIVRDGKYLVGIEFDTRLYAAYPDTRDRDIHRLTYLELRGWFMMRVWAPAWWRDPEGVIARLVEAANGQATTGADAPGAVGADARVEALAPAPNTNPFASTQPAPMEAVPQDDAPQSGINPFGD